jgi:hypothetical protein
MEQFKYLGKMVKPLRQFTKEEEARGLRLPLRSIGIDNYRGKWDYDKFYAKAKKAGAGEIDIFEYCGIKVVPCSNELFQIIDR